MFQAFGELKQDIKDAVNPTLVKDGIESSWSDFWNFVITKSESGDVVTLGTVIIAVICFVIGILISKAFSRRLVKSVFSRFEMTPSALHIWDSITFYMACLFTTIIALKIAHVPLTIFTFMGGALALGIGFGSKNLVNNFISGLIFMFEAPAKLGDFVEVDGYFGRVISVGMRATHIELGLTRRAIVPNSSFLEKSIVNWGTAGSPIYLNVTVSVDYGANLKKIEDLLLEAPKGVAQVMDALPFRVYLVSFDDSGIRMDLSFPVQIFSPADRDIITSDVRKKIELAFVEEGFSMPYPQLVLHQSSPQ